MSALPWDKWFWSDYDADEGLRVCSLAAQGLWWRMLSLMARATPKGDLRIGGEPCTVVDLSRSVGVPEEMVTDLLGELERRGVFSRTRTGVIFSRKMRKDAEISAKRARAGAKGADATNRKTNDNQDLPQQNNGKDTGKASSKSPAPEARSQSSVDKESTGVPPVDPVKELFDLGVFLITGAGYADQQARSIIGRWRKAHGDDATLDALRDAKQLGISEPVEWVQARFTRQAGGLDEYLETLGRKYADAKPLSVPLEEEP